MKLHRPVVATLALFVGLPALGFADADAAFIRRSVVKTVINANGSSNYRVAATVSDDTSIASVDAELESDAGTEELPLVEADAWLHGAATITALPASDADLSVTLHDADSAALMSFSGTLGADGSVTLTADNAKFDIDLLAAELFTAEKGYDLAIDLAGADTYAVAYASVTVTESKERSTRAEFGWDDIGSVWEADTALAHEGFLELKVHARDARGKKVETSKARLGAPWADEGDGVSALATDEDPLTRVALHRRRAAFHASRAATHSLTVISDGWTSDTAPTHAEIEITDGDTLTVAVNSYQRVGDCSSELDGGPCVLDGSLVTPGSTLSITSGSLTIADRSVVSFLDSPGCVGGSCFTLLDNGDDTYTLAVSAYGATTEELTDTAGFTFSVADANGEIVRSDELFVTFDDSISAVFANEVDFASDPVGLGLVGKVKLLGAPNARGRQETLAKGRFFAEIARDTDGDVELAGGDKDIVVSSGTVIVAGPEIGLEDNEGNPDAPPAIQYGVAGNGSGTKNASSQTSIKPQLL